MHCTELYIYFYLFFFFFICHCPKPNVIEAWVFMSALCFMDRRLYEPLWGSEQVRVLAGAVMVDSFLWFLIVVDVMWLFSLTCPHLDDGFPGRERVPTQLCCFDCPPYLGNKGLAWGNVDVPSNPKLCCARKTMSPRTDVKKNIINLKMVWNSCS